MWAKEAIMEKNRKRALRRFHDERMLNRAKEMILEWYWYDQTPDLEVIHQQARRRRDDMCACSCAGCGNQRHTGWLSRRDRLTMPEKKAEDSYLAAIEEYLTVDTTDNE